MGKDTAEGIEDALWRIAEALQLQNKILASNHESLGRISELMEIEVKGSRIDWGVAPSWADEVEEQTVYE